MAAKTGQLKGRARSIRPNFRSITGIYHSRFGPLQFESKLERDSYILLDFVPSISNISEQPFRLGNYTPDCLIESINGTRLIAEIKYENELVNDWQALSPKFHGANLSAERMGATFGFITDSTIYARKHLVDILKWIRFTGVADAEENAMMTNDIDFALRKRFSKDEKMTLIGLANIVDRNNPANSLRQICRLIITGRLQIEETPTQNPLEAIVVSTTDPEEIRNDVRLIFVPYNEFVRVVDFGSPGNQYRMKARDDDHE